ncbi:uncharacterized protein Bfra_001710 [Botrytis fragariae]|uniref:Uncharacterized protein n=1 Tax=Botrytis fragariae TaxID=1964551 RepID=A0A8H6B0S8_9HELO|nr:uncharacterized protein Bfra_001710 [Botrytis fragariae]KAF5877343.1 hypothetical protein Bfra_001710 [Botrytis fragariae]
MLANLNVQETESDWFELYDNCRISVSWTSRVWNELDWGRKGRRELLKQFGKNGKETSSGGT